MNRTEFEDLQTQGLLSNEPVNECKSTEKAGTTGATRSPKGNALHNDMGQGGGLLVSLFVSYMGWAVCLKRFTDATALETAISTMTYASTSVSFTANSALHLSCRLAGAGS